MIQDKQKLTRRSFLRTSAAVGAAIGAPMIVPASALGLDGKVAPSNRVVMGCIGVGSMGTGNLKSFLKFDEVQVIAVCDVDRQRVEKTKTLIDEKYGNSDCATHGDFRELIGRGDLDAVSIAVPDHWHALPAIAAARAGLDIYAEKPLARSIREGQAIRDTVRRYGRIWQTGSWQRSRENFHRAAELVRAGRIGKVIKTEVGLPTGRPMGVHSPEPIPEGLDYDFWLGPAPWTPYRPLGDEPDRRCHWDWRWIMDYSGGQLTDWAGHHIDIAHWGLGFDLTGPVEIEGKGVYPEDGLYNAPTEYKIHYKYKNGMPMTVANNQQIPQGTKWIGEEGWVYVSRGKFETEPKSLLDEVIGPEEIHLYHSRDHQKNFLDCVKSRQTTITPSEVAHRSISVALLGEIAMLTGRKIKWDPDNEEIIGDPAAAALLGRSYREPWAL